MAHEKGALMVAYVEPSTLGVLTPPSQYGADISCGDIQALGLHMNYGGGVAGFIATKDEPKFVDEYPSRLFGIAPTDEKEWGFGDVLWERTSFANRDHAKEFVGTHAALWGIAAGVYLASMGPQGMKELGEAVASAPGLPAQEPRWCQRRIARQVLRHAVPGVRRRFLGERKIREGNQQGAARARNPRRLRPRRGIPRA